MALYIWGLAPTISWRDSPEFVTVVHTLGISHPAGSPTYTLLAKLLTFLPLGSIALRVNLFSALCGAWVVAVPILEDVTGGEDVADVARGDAGVRVVLSGRIDLGRRTERLNEQEDKGQPAQRESIHRRSSSISIAAHSAIAPPRSSGPKTAVRSR